MSQRLIFFGTDAFSAPSLEALLAHKFNVMAVVTKPDARVGRGRELTAPPVKQIAQRHGIPVLQPEKLSDITSDIAALEPDAAIVVAYGKIIPQAVLDLFPKGLINVHASLLPKYRGSSPIEAAILNGDHETGVTLMKLNARMDAGPVYITSSLPLDGTETRPALYDKLSTFGAHQLIFHLAGIFDKSYFPQDQNDDEATYVRLITKADGVIDWTKPAARLEREVRAYLGWPGSRTQLLGADVTITAAHVLSGPTPGSDAYPGLIEISADRTELRVNCGQDRLVIGRLKPAGKREMTAREFLLGRRA
jgi:methionyl-tRNA formyltransferase